MRRGRGCLVLVFWGSELELTFRCPDRKPMHLQIRSMKKTSHAGSCVVEGVGGRVWETGESESGRASRGREVLRCVEGIPVLFQTI